MSKKRTVVYKLAGRSLDAARRLEKELRHDIELTPPLSTGTFQEIGDCWDAIYKNLLARLSCQMPDVLELCGINARSVTVQQGRQTLPRAYAEAPEIFLSPDRSPEYFMYVPIDYKGAHFIPADAVLLDEKEEKITGDRLFAGGWLGNAPLVSIKKRGVATPADSPALSKSELQKAFSYFPNDGICFLADGRSLEIIKDLKSRTAEWERKVKEACDAIEAAAEKIRPQILANLPAGEDVHINATHSYAMYGGGRAKLALSATREGKNNFWDAGKKMPIPPLLDCTLQDAGHEYVVTPRRDTPQGCRLADIIDAIPDTPGLLDYPELYADYTVKPDDIGQSFGENGTVPKSIEVAGRTFLIYAAAPDSRESDFCPPGAKPFSAAALQWLRDDETDRRMGVVPPPMPKEVADALITAMQKKPPPPKRPPQP